MKRIEVKIKNSQTRNGRFEKATIYNFFSDNDRTTTQELNRVIHALSMTTNVLEKENKGFDYSFPFELS